MIPQIRHLWQLLRFFGLRWLLYRILYSVRLRSGLLCRQMPALPWAAKPLQSFLKDPSLAEPGTYLTYRQNSAPLFFFKTEDRICYKHLYSAWDLENSNPVVMAQEISKGSLRYFEYTRFQTGFPPDWFENPFTGQQAPRDRHWSQIDDFGYGDIKAIWEASRFGFVYTLVRAYWRSGEERYADLFWKALEDWYENNPPQKGPNWKCGQEISFRVMAWCFALYGFMGSKSTTAERVARLAQMIGVSGERVEANLDYALSQRNNHGISEGMVLWTIGILFPEFRSAERWWKLGLQVLERLGRELIYDDGSFVQHSVNYHRLMLHDYLWALRLGELNNQLFSPELKERLLRAGAFLYDIQDEQSGEVPCYGHNDGSLILPLSNCDYSDFRPVNQALYYLFHKARCYENGPWDEDLLWLFGTEALDAPVQKPRRVNLRADDGGYYTLRSDEGFSFIRCATFRDRPGQADMLHVDLWWRGQNMAMDSGTYSYNSPDPWNNPFSHTSCHNTVTVDGADQMDSVGKFLWLPWLKSDVRDTRMTQAGHLVYWEGSHDGYHRLEFPVEHRRGVLRIGPEHWLICDGLGSDQVHEFRLHWLLPDLSYLSNDNEGFLNMKTFAGEYSVRIGALPEVPVCSVVRADDNSPRGWCSPYYGHREPALSMDAVARGSRMLFWSLFGPGPTGVAVDGECLNITTGEWQGRVRLNVLNAVPGKALLSSIVVTGLIEDHLELR